MPNPARILIIEDSEADFALLELNLQRGGLEATCDRCDDVAGLEAAISKSSYDLVLCDYIVPGFDTDKIVTMVEQSGHDIPVIIISGVVKTGDVVDVLKAGAIDFVEKDDLARLVPSVKRALEDVDRRAVLRETELQLRQAQKMEIVGQLTGGIAHDFNNLLQVVLGNLEMAESRLDNDPDTRELLRASIHTTRRGADLIRHLLLISRKHPLTSEAVDLNDLLPNITTLLQRTLGSNIAVGCKADDKLDLVMVDRAQLESALLNLAINARDAMVNGGELDLTAANVTLNKENHSEFPDLDPGDYVMMGVSDTGAGMSAETAEKAIEPFFTTKEGAAGSGLGLSTVFGFVKESGGQISIKSAEEQGTEVSMYFPAYRGEKPAQAPAPAPEEKRRGDESILVVEDDADVRDLLVNALQRLGYTVEQAADSKGAGAILEKGFMPQLLLSDLSLPGGVNGIAIAEVTRQKYPNIKVLFISGDASREDAEKQGLPLIPKPFGLTQLANRVRDILDQG